MTKSEVMAWKHKRDIAAQREKELLRQTSDAVRLRQLQAMFATVRSENWPVSTPEDAAQVRARWNTLRRAAARKSADAAPKSDAASLR